MSLCCRPAAAQNTAQNSAQNNPQNSLQMAPVPARIIDAIDPSNTVTLRGNVHPMARAEYDRGAVADGQPLHRMLLLLQRSPEQETALRQLLDQQQSKASGNFHSWLTPQQFGAQFGPAASDVQAVSAWLQSQGFQINRVSAGQTVIEFAGNAGQVRNAFHTQIHNYVVNGLEHTANASDPEIPVALAPVVTGIVSLNNFPAQSHLLNMGTYKRNAKTGGGHPLYTPTGSTENFPLAPADFARIYNVTPLWNAGIDGTGQSIAIVGESNISVSDIQNFRALFGLPNNFNSNNIILDGIDPGIVDDDETESDLDIEWSGAVAKNATIKFVTAASTEATSGVHLAALYIVDNNVAPVLSESYGVCEQSLKSTNQFYNALWEQAAAQGITVVISAGDGGSAGCDDFNNEKTATQGLAISGYASTPFNVAVGGTDFDQVNKWQQFWSPTNDPSTLASALGYIPEIPWNDSCAQLGLGGCGTSQPGGNLLDIVAGSGGPSSLYSKPLWQSGTGVPQDNKRDIPDVSLFASNGFTGSGYLICEADQQAFCEANNQFFSYQQVGGTSASAPAFAGIMALVNHSQAKQNLGNRQGNANYVLYALAAKQNNVTPALNCNASAAPAAACTFNDVTKGNSFFANSTVGNNSVPCKANTTNCSSTTSANGILIAPTASTTKTPAWTTNSGYDMATGLGSVNAQNLATNWQTANGTATTTTLTLNGGTAVNVTHGSSVPVSITVTPKAAIGDVALIGAVTSTSSVGMGRFPLANGAASGSTSNLAGGTYKVTAHYEGDGTNAPSDSAAVTVTVAPESSNTFLTVPTFDPNSGRELSSTPSSLVYGSPYLVRVDVTNSTGSPTQLCASVAIPACPTGTVSLTDSLNGASAKPLDGGTFLLNGEGYTEDQIVNLVGGAHVLTAQYNHDNSFMASASAPYSLTVTPAPSKTFFTQENLGPIVGQAFTLAGEVQSSVFQGVAPTGTVSFFDGATQLPGVVTMNSAGSPPALSASIAVTVTTGGAHAFSMKYSGDSNYAASSNSPDSAFAVYPTNTTMKVSAQNIIFGATVTATATVSTSVKTPALSGTLIFFSPGFGQLQGQTTQTVGTDASGNTQLIATIITAPGGSGSIMAEYFGDNNFASSNSQSFSIQVTTPDFTIAAPPTVFITAGQTGTATLTITPVSNLSSTVVLTCGGELPAGSTCSLNPASVNLANGVAATTVLSVTSLAPSAATPAMVITTHRKSIFAFFGEAPRGRWFAISFAAGCFALGLLLFAARRPRGRVAFPSAFAAGLLCVVGLAMGCGGGGGNVLTPPPPPQKAVSTTTLTSSTPKVDQFTTSNITATVTSSKTVTGNVTFTTNGFNWGTIPLVNGVAVGGVANLRVGTTPVNAAYSGDANNLPSTGTFNQTTTGTLPMFVNAQTGVNMHLININATVQ